MNYTWRHAQRSAVGHSWRETIGVRIHQKKLAADGETHRTAIAGMEQACLVLRPSYAALLATGGGALFCEALISALTTDLPESRMLSVASSLVHASAVPRGLTTPAAGRPRLGRVCPALVRSLCWGQHTDYGVRKGKLLIP